MLWLLFVLIISVFCSGKHSVYLEGKETSIEDHPFHLSLEFNGVFMCGATLLAPNVAVTAAHCIDPIKEDLKSLVVRAGTSIQKKGGSVVKVAEICPNPSYDDLGAYDYDVSVIKLEEEFVLNDAIQLIPLRARNNEVEIGTRSTVTGWGSKEVSGHLLAGNVWKTLEDVCQNAYYFEMTPRMECYGSGTSGEKICVGDPGSSLVVDGKLAGIFSYGERCINRDKSRIYTKISDPEIYDYIEDCITQFS